MNQDWITAFEALKSVYIDEAYSNIAINEAISHHQGCRDSFVRTLVKGTIRDTIRIDGIIEELASNGLKSIKKRTLIVLRMGIYALRSMDSVPDHAAVNEAVKLARNVAKGTDRFVNAILRSYIRQKEDIENKTISLALRYSFPESIATLLQSQYGDDTEQILKGLNEPPHVILRVNPLKTDADHLIRLLSENGISAKVADDTGMAIEAEGSGIIHSEMFRNGLFTVQSLSSITAVKALDPKPGNAVLDMCAAPGGKSTMMAEMMQNDGKIVACDIHEHRLSLIEAASERLGIDIIETRLLDGTVYDSSLAENFDCVLADVPCSGLGVAASKPEIKLKADLKQFESLYPVQLDILRNAVKYVKPGGLIEYSTCTLNKKENDEIVEKLLKECSFVSVIEKHTILPYNNLVGFYYSILRKNA